MSNLVQKNEFLSQLERLREPAEQELLQPDAELLSLYVDGGSREAIERLIRRYAPMVASVCRLTVSDASRAEDAFQATFLILLKSAKKIRKQSSVAAWLHGVAYRTATRMRKQARDQAAHSGLDEVIHHCETMADPISELARKMELEALDRELEKLPERLRAPLVEHYLLGFSAPEIAERMELSTSAVEGRLRRGRRQLRSLLAKRGISLSVLMAGSGLFQQHLEASDAVCWTSRFMEHHLPPADGTAMDSVHIFSSSPEVSSLVTGELSMISTATLKASLAAGILLMAGTLAVLAADQEAIDPWNSGKGGPQAITLSDLDTEPHVLAQLGSVPIQDSAGTTGQNLQFANQGPAGGVGQIGTSRAASTSPSAVNAATGTLGGSPRLSNLATQTQAGSQTGNWQQPDTNEGNQPVWLTGGEESMQAMEKNRAVLSQKVEFDFSGVPLANVAEWLTEQSGVQFEVNLSEIELLGVDPEQPVSVKGHASVKELLRRMLGPLELSYLVTESTIEITSKDAAEADPAIRFYDLAYVLPNASNAEALVNAIQQSADPDSWLAAGGTSSISIVGSTMIVAAPQSTHQKIEVILLNLTKMNRRNVENAPPQLSNPVGGASAGGGGGMF